MKKWYFSENGKVSKPMALEEAIQYAQNNPTSYGWHPSFLQWKPVTIISEFGTITSDVKPAMDALTELIEKFKIKKQRLDKKLNVIEQRIEVNDSLLKSLESEIKRYKKQTENLSEGVKNAISGIEQQYNSLKEKQSRLHEAASISISEIEALVVKFEAKTSSTSTEKSVSKAVKPVQKSAQSADQFLEQQVGEASLRAVNAEHAEVVDIDVEYDQTAKPVRSAKVKLVDINSRKPKQEAQAPEKKEKPEPKVQQEDTLSTTASKLEQKEEHQTVEQEQHHDDDEKMSLTGVKSLIKSVFKGEDPSTIQENSLSKLLAMEEEQTADPQADSEAKPKRRRRRR